MKTTVEIADALLDQAKRVAQKEGTTLRALLEEGLRHSLEGRRERRRPFKLRKVTYGSGGLQPELGDRGWERLRELAYEERGA